MKTKKFNPAYIVDITNCENDREILCAFGIAKQKAGFAITDDELDAIVNENSIITIIENTPIVINNTCDCKKKLPWYKRFWNWLTRKK